MNSNKQCGVDYPTLDPNLCTVAYACGPGGTGVAIWVHDKQQCWVLCQGTGTIANIDQPRVGLETRISAEVKSLERARLAEFLATICEFELFIPAALASEKITLDVKEITLGDFVERTGLVATIA